ncbi:beta-1,3-galactosyltransferase 2 isoform X1 [Dicentrarchus labrax]|uniref:Hexosyltransferase n=1 Tax=Dicentrarchus labrax TaxID=13489 RepID=A0A8P4KQR7_DICLA|nr:beta-1,3-galactosyltransferase 2 isoform X1 [Dicentrarchus labrax]
MIVQGGPAEGVVRPPASATGRVMTFNLRRLLLSALRRALKAEVGVLSSMLSASPLGSHRLVGSLSAEVQGITSHKELVKSQCHQKKHLFHSWFQFLVLFCLVLFVLCYTLSNSSQPWLASLPLHKHYQRIFNRTNKVFQPPAYRVHPKHRVKLNGIPETTEIPTVSPTGIQYHQAYARNYHFIMDNEEVCKTKIPFLVLMVPVAPHNVQARDAIRETWGKRSVVQGEVVLTLFLLGSSGGANVEQQQEKLIQENLQHHDLIQSDFMDTYLNLTIKTMVIMDWLATHCRTAAYAMKIDSDMFLNIDNLVIMLQKPGIPKMNYLTGLLMWNRPVVRSKDSKWYVPEEMYPEATYPTYTLGMGYIFSNDLPEKFVGISKSIKPFNIEDAYIGMCIKKLGYAPTSPPNPSQFRAYNTRYDRCEYSKIITYILGSPQELVKYWTDLKKPGPPC